LVLGVIWGAWHLPLLLSDPTAQRPAGPYLAWVLAASVILTWVYSAAATTS